MWWFIVFAVVVYPVVIEFFVLPKPEKSPVFRRSSVVNLAASHLTFSLLILLSGRVLLSCAALLAILTTLVLINNAKFRALREPVLFNDFNLLKQIAKYPKVYFPFFGTLIAIVLLLCVVVVIFLFWLVDVPIDLWRSTVAGSSGGYSWLLIYPLCLLAGCGALFFRPDTIKKIFKPLGGQCLHFDGNKDVARFGLVATIFFHYFFARSQRPAVRLRMGRRAGQIEAQIASLPATKLSLPELVVVVQAESFLDVRKLHESIPKDTLKHFDDARRSSALYGKLEVPAWGANTVRTEFSVLTGIANVDLGLESGNPYLNLVTENSWSFARRYKDLGYRTVCLHPYYAGFYGRARALARLGFDEFLDIRAFPRQGVRSAYVGDVEFAEKLIGLVQHTTQPMFLFGITMEAHGPFAAGRRQDTQPLAPESPLRDSDLPEYLKHLRSSDEMIRVIRSGLQDCAGDYSLCVYGDHVPSLPIAYEIADFVDTKTDYLLLSSATKEKPLRMDLAAHQLFEQIVTR